MKEPQLSRRKILAGMGLASGSGLAVGSGAGAFFSDRETFANNSITAGAVDLNVNWDRESDGEGTSEGEPNISIEPEDKSGSIHLTVAPKSESELPDGESNPVYPWFRVSCPENVELADNIVITLKYKDGDEEVIIDQPLLVAAALLRNGEPLYPGGGSSVGLEGRECLSAGDPLELVFEWKIEDGDEFDGDNGVAFPIEFLGRQCRHNDGTANPFPEREPCPDEGQGISFIAFCADVGPINPSIDLVLTADKDNPTSVLWSTDEPVKYVVVKYGDKGPKMTIYDYSGDPKTSGLAMSDDPGAFKPSYDEQPGQSSIPCEVADDLVNERDKVKAGEDPDFVGECRKLEYQEDTQQFAEKPCKDKDD